MMTMNDVLMKFFKLPPGVKMMLAVLGFGSLATLFYTFGRPLWRGFLAAPMIMKIGIVAVIAAAVLAVFVIIWLRRRRSGKQATKLEGELNKSGPTRGEEIEAQQVYRGKFKEKLAKLRELGKNVYDMPWYVLMGEPGCGKTASLINSGIDFPLGQDETPGFGGTRNYNWWFANQAVILDTAGRISFQEEGTTDKVEWEYFLKLLKDNRSRCPINGLIVAIPCDKLLNDSSEDRNNKATILRERLRQIHQTLGWRFPTYILITKCDLVAGFSEFFEEFRPDVPMRRQMLGWSRPGPFEETYDPATFGSSFDQIYGGLRDWAMRYLQRNLAERELGMIVTFPEAFRALRKPLEEYVAKVFQKSPLVEPPFFRGFYFTSAVQEGAPIMSIFDKTHVGGVHTAATPGAKAADSKPFFIQDLYEQKVFEEKGLVFRSSKHVATDKRSRTLVWAGCGALLVAMVAFMLFGYYTVRDLVENPREDCTVAADVVKNQTASLPEIKQHSERVHRLDNAARNFSGFGNALAVRAILPWASIDTPKESVETVQKAYVTQALVRPVIDEVEKAFHAPNAARYVFKSPERERFLRALEASIRWLAEASREDPPKLDADEVKLFSEDYAALLAYARASAQAAAGATAAQSMPTAATADDPVVVEFRHALDQMSGSGGRFADLLKGDPRGYNPARSSTAIVAALNQLKKDWEDFVKFGDKSDDPIVNYWLRLMARAGAVRAKMAALVALGDGFRSKQDDKLKAAREGLMTITEDANLLGDKEVKTSPKADSLAAVLYELMKLLQGDVPLTADKNNIVRIDGLLAYLKDTYWGPELKRFEDALNGRLKVEANRLLPNPARVYQALNVGEALQHLFEDNRDKWLANHGLKKGTEPLKQLEEEGLLTAIEKKDESWRTGTRVEIRLADKALGEVFPKESTTPALRTALLELRTIVEKADQAADLSDLRNWPNLVGNGSDEFPDKSLLGDWWEKVKAKLLDAKLTDSQRTDFKAAASYLGPATMWSRPLDAYDLLDGIQVWRRNVGTSSILAKMTTLATECVGQNSRRDDFIDMRGLGRLVRGFDDPTDLPFLRRGATAEVAPTPEPKRETPQPATKPVDPFARDFGPAPVPTSTSAPTTAPGPAPKPRDDRKLLARYHTLDYLIGTLRVHALLSEKLTAPGAPAGSAELKAALDRAAAQYVQDYFAGWLALYGNCERLLGTDVHSFITRCRGGIAWDDYAKVVGDPANKFGVEIATRLDAIATHFARWHKFTAGPRPEIEAAVLKFIADRRPEFPSAMMEIAAWQGTGVLALTQPVNTAWQQFATAAKNTPWPPKADASGVPPDASKLEKDIVVAGGTSLDNRLLAAVAAIAHYGEDQLRYEVETKFRSIFQAHANSFPFTKGGAAMNTQTLEGLLIEAAAIQETHGALLSALAGDGLKPTLVKCKAWTNFLWPRGTPGKDPPVSRKVTVKVTPRSGAGYAALAEAYKALKYSMPLKSESGSPMQEVSIGLIPVPGQNPFAPRDFLFDLRGQGLPSLNIRISDKNANVPSADEQPIAAGTNNPLEFLNMLDTSGSEWVKGWELSIPSWGKIGCDLIITVGADAAAYPGEIPLPNQSIRAVDTSVFDKVCR